VNPCKSSVLISVLTTPTLNLEIYDYE
jgi:hypothetical protein